MPRNSSGTMTLPAPGVPFQSGQTISSAQVNATLSDVATEISDSASRSGKGGFTAQVRGVDGTVAAPALSFTAEQASGLYRAGATDVRLAVGGVDALKLGPGGVAGNLALTATPSAQVLATGADGQLIVQGNRVAASIGIDVIAGSTATRTAGVLLAVQNPVGTTNKLFVDYQGLLQLQNAAALQPASLWTAIVTNANWAGADGFAYWKDAGGMVHIKGSFSFSAGAANPIFTLPAGFRPAATRGFHLLDAASAGGLDVTVLSNGNVTTVAAGTAGHVYYADPISFLAEA